MPGRTNTERIEDIGKQVIVLTRDVEHLTTDVGERAGLLRSELSEAKVVIHQQGRRIDLLEQRQAQMESFDPSQVPIQTERIRNLEKLVDEGRTRKWQVWLAFLGAALSAAIALTVAFIKK